ncbi:MAG: glycosyltransferase [Myxococcales bacterium]|nr:glycosyltransferase [Myxococcales bacterium]MDH3485914.1 glycosyltransferase [Myxococcales bacterium]
MDKLPFTVVHYGGKDPRSTTGGVETFARNLALSFRQVEFMTPRNRDFDRVRRERIPVICDNQRVRDWPKDIPVIGFQHGFAKEKAWVTKSPGHVVMATEQWLASRRPNTLWVACAEWIAKAFSRSFGTNTEEVIYHPIDVERFDGRLDNDGSRLILHDARTRHKGKHLLPRLQAAYPDWTFEPLACKPEDVPDRMRKAGTFIHLSAYEGNSIVCNEAMAMNLPCMFTDVGLMRDSGRPQDVRVISAKRAFSDARYLHDELGAFLRSLATHSYQPRRWILTNATAEVALERWARAMDAFFRMAGW